MHAPTHTDIEVRAYHIWEQEGRPQGRQLDHWLRAEQEFSLVQPAQPRRAARKPTNAGKTAPASAPKKTARTQRPSL